MKQDITAKAKAEAVMTINRPVLLLDEMTSNGAEVTGTPDGADCDMLNDRIESGREKNGHG